MKAFFTRFSLLLILGLTALVSKAVTVTIDNINYELYPEYEIAIIVSARGGVDYGDLTIKSSITINGKDYSVTQIGNQAFYNCYLKSVTIPNSVLSIGEGAFKGCSLLTSATIGNSVNYIGAQAFLGCSSLTEVTIPDLVTKINSSTFYDCTNLKKVTIPTSVTEIEVFAFERCSSLTEVTIPNSVLQIGASAFSKCSKLTNVSIPSSVYNMANNVFSGCSSLKSISVDKNNPNYADYEGVLYDKNITEIIICPEAKITVTIPNTVTTISSGTFKECLELKYISVEKDNPNFADIDGVLYNKAITAVRTCPCAKTSVSIPNTVTNITPSAFYNCKELTEVVIPNSVTMINPYAFMYCTGLTKVIIPNSVTRIGWQAFQYCTALKEVTIPNSVTELESDAFYGCSALTTVIYEAENPIKGSSVTFGNTTYDNATLYVPKNAVEKCKEIDPWKNFKTIVAIPVPAESVKLDKETLELKIGETATLTATVTPENTTDDLIWKSSNEKVATVDAEGKITAVALGEAVITATCGEAKAECKVTVKLVPAESMKLDKEAVELKIGETATLTATVSPENTTDKTVTWKSSDEKVATVDAEGKITAIALGEAVITATCGEAKAECKVTVKPIPAESVKLDKEAVELKIGETATLTATVSPENTTDKTVTWKSSDEKIATVDANGKITAIALGEAIITATCGDAKAECKVTVKPVPAESITLDKVSVVLKIGETATVTATVNPENTTDKTVTWASSNPGVATVDANGKITAVALGEAVVTATCGEAKAECNVGVTAVPVESVKLDKQALEMKVGDVKTLTATVSPDNATYKTVAWTSSNTNVATVDSEGEVTAVGVGEAVITAACGDAKAECYVTVKPIPAESVKLDKQTVDLKVGETATLNATVSPATATDKTVTWTSSNEKVATVNANGKVTAIGVGEAVITAACGEAKAECKVTVTAESGIEAAEANEPVVTVSAMTINVSGVEDDCKVSVYNLSGEMIASETGCCSIAVTNRGVYIVRVGAKIVKVAI